MNNLLARIACLEGQANTKQLQAAWMDFLMQHSAGSMLVVTYPLWSPEILTRRFPCRRACYFVNSTVAVVVLQDLQKCRDAVLQGNGGIGGGLTVQRYSFSCTPRLRNAVSMSTLIHLVEPCQWQSRVQDPGSPTAESQHTPEASLFLQPTPATHPHSPPIAPRPHTCCPLAASTGSAAAHYTPGPAQPTVPMADQPKYTPHVQADPTSQGYALATHGYPLRYNTLDALLTHGQPSAEAAAARAHSMSQQGYNAAPTAESQHTPEASLFLQPATHPSVFQTQAAPPHRPQAALLLLSCCPNFHGGSSCALHIGPRTSGRPAKVHPTCASRSHYSRLPSAHS